MPLMNADDFEQFSSLQSAPDFRSGAEQENSLLSIFDHNNPDIAYMEREALTYIFDAGAWTNVYLRTNDLGQVDPVWEEDSNPIYEQPHKFKGVFAPDSVAISMVKWGLDSSVKFKVSYSRAWLLHTLGDRLIRKGDVIRIPHNTMQQLQNTEYLDGKVNQMDQFRVLEATDTGNFNYRWLYWTCTVEPLTGDISVRVEE